MAVGQHDDRGGIACTALFVGLVDQQGQRGRGLLSLLVGHREGEGVGSFEVVEHRGQLSADVEGLGGQSLDLVADRKSKSLEHGGLRSADRAEVKLFDVQAAERGHEVFVGRGDGDVEAGHLAGDRGDDLEGLRAEPLLVEHRGRQLERLPEVVACPHERGGFDKRFLDVERLPEPFGAVDGDRLVEDETVDLNVELHVALIGIGDYQFDLAPLTGLDARDRAGETGLPAVGEGSGEDEVERILFAGRQKEGGLAAVPVCFVELQRGIAQRNDDFRVIGQLLGQIRRAEQCHLDVLQRADDLSERGRDILRDREGAGGAVDRHVPGCGLELFVAVRTDRQIVVSDRQLHGTFGESALQLGIGAVEGRALVARVDDRHVVVVRRDIGPGGGVCLRRSLGCILRVIGADVGLTVGNDAQRERLAAQITRCPGLRGAVVRAFVGRFFVDAARQQKGAQGQGRA